MLTGVYDAVIQRLLPERQLKARLVEQARIRGAMRVLDVGAGTATLALMIKQGHPSAEVIGLDADPGILSLARAKVSAFGLAVRLDQGWATTLPYPDAYFDRVVSSLLLHHLDRGAKLAALREMQRVLKPAGALHILDFGRPHTRLAWLISLVSRRFERTADNIRGLIPELMQQAGFSEVAETGQQMALVGTLSLYRGIKY